MLSIIYMLVGVKMRGIQMNQILLVSLKKLIVW